jgi:hypothetical protein
MSRALNNHEAALRRALHAAADQIEPSEDGLERIQARLHHPRPFPVAWAEALRVQLSLRMPEALASAAAYAAHELRVISERFMPDPGDGGAARSGRLQLGWLRPLAAMGTAVFIVAAVVYMAIKVPQVISPTGNAASAVHTGRGASPRTGQTHGSSQTLGNGKSGTPGPSHHPSGSPNTQSCSPASYLPTLNPSPTGTPPVLTTPPQSPSPSSSPTTTASPTPTPTPTPTDSSSTTPSGAGSTPTSGSVGTPAPSDMSQSPAGRAGDSQARQALAKDTGLVHTVAETSTPCTSPSPKTSKKSASHKVISPAAAGQLVLQAGGATLAPAEVRSRLG